MTSCGQKLAPFFKMSGHANFLSKLLKISLRNILLIAKYFYKTIFIALSNIYSMVFNTIQRRMGWIDWKELFGILRNLGLFLNHQYYI